MTKAVILAGGFGTRISEETSLKPKPMIEIGNRPILWHIMKIYSFYGINEFIICLGYKGSVIKEYFINYKRYSADVTLDLQNDEIELHNDFSEPWKITLINTGETTMTGSRIKKIIPFLKNEELFCLTYGDVLADVNISELIAFHKKHKKLATVTATVPIGRFGALNIASDKVVGFQEKPKGQDGYINGGFFILSPKIVNYIDDDEFSIWEQSPLKNLAKDGELMSFKHEGFWQPMDTLRDKKYLEDLWISNQAPWKIW